MRIIEADINRDLHSETIFRCGSFEYRLNKDFLKMPENLRYTPIVTGCCDAEDNIYLATRDADHPIVKVDAEGRYIRDFGKGLFNFIHSVYVTNHGTLLCADSNLHVIWELSTEGETIRHLGEIGKASDSGYDGDIWRRMHREGEIIPMNIAPVKDWAFIESIKTIKRAAGPFNRPTCAVETSKGNIFVSDGYANCAFHKFILRLISDSTRRFIYNTTESNFILMICTERNISKCILNLFPLIKFKRTNNNIWNFSM